LRQSSNLHAEGQIQRRSTRARKQRTFFADNVVQPKGGGKDNDNIGSVASEGGDGDPSDDEEASAEEEEEVVVSRKSSRSTAFRGEMKDPSNSIADLLKPLSAKKARRGARVKRSSIETTGDSDEGSDEEMYNSPVKKKSARRKGAAKSPAKRHSKRRMSKRLENPEYAESSEDEDASEDEDTSEGEDSEEEDDNEDVKIKKIIACKSMTLGEWKEVCKKMNTTEVTNGSRWIQEENDADPEKYEERFLIKWDNLSYLHCSWETERDMVQFCEGAKGRLSTFFRKAEGGLLYGQDERLDGVSFV
jgi:hypothetical protein